MLNYLYCIPLLFWGTLFYRMGREYIEVSYHEKFKKKLN